MNVFGKKKEGLWKLDILAGTLREGLELDKISSNILGKALYQIYQEITGEDRGIKTNYYKLFMMVVKRKKTGEKNV